MPRRDGRRKETDFYVLDTADITLLNLEKIHVQESYPHISSVEGNATDLMGYGDKSERTFAL